MIKTSFFKLNTIVLILCFCSIKLCLSQELNNKDVKKKSEIDLRRIEVASVIELFCGLLIENDIKLNTSGNSNLITLEIDFSDFNEKYGIEFNNTIALALGSNIDSLVKIDINNNLWDSLSKLEKVSTIFHEVCHDLLNVKHIEGDELNLMHPFAQPSSLNELQIMFDKFIRDYKGYRVETFDEGFYIHDMTKSKKPYLIILKK